MGPLLLCAGFANGIRIMRGLTPFPQLRPTQQRAVATVPCRGTSTSGRYMHPVHADLVRARIVMEREARGIDLNVRCRSQLWHHELCVDPNLFSLRGRFSVIVRCPRNDSLQHHLNRGGQEHYGIKSVVESTLIGHAPIHRQMPIFRRIRQQLMELVFIPD